MLALLFYYIFLPMFVGYGIVRIIQRYAPHEAPAYLRALWEETPMQPKSFRAVRLDGQGADKKALWLGDFESLPAAVDAIYLARDEARQKEPAVAASFIAFNEKMEALEEVDV